MGLLGGREYSLDDGSFSRGNERGLFPYGFWDNTVKRSREVSGPGRSVMGMCDSEDQ